jgi:hypothetical protein
MNLREKEMKEIKKKRGIEYYKKEIRMPRKWRMSKKVKNHKEIKECREGWNESEEREIKERMTKCMKNVPVNRIEGQTEGKWNKVS